MGVHDRIETVSLFYLFNLHEVMGRRVEHLLLESDGTLGIKDTFHRTHPVAAWTVRWESQN